MRKTKKKMKKFLENIIDLILWLPVVLSLPFILFGRLLRLKKRYFLALVLKYMRWKVGLEARRNGRSFEEELDLNKPVKAAYEMMWKETGLR